MKHTTSRVVFALAAWALTLTLAAVPPTLPQIAAEIERLTKANPQLAQDPAALSIFAAKASGNYSIDRRDPQYVVKRGFDINGRLKTGTTYEEIMLNQFGRTAEMQRFLEMHDLAATKPAKGPDGSKEMIRIARNRIRYVAAIFQRDISKLEEVWRNEDLTSALTDMNEALKSIAIQQGRIADEIMLLRYRQPQIIK